MQITLEDIRKRVDELALKINVPKKLLPNYGQLEYEAHPYIELDNVGFMHYVISERGHEYKRKVTDKLDDLLFWIFSDITFSMAYNYEIKNRIEDKDGRRIIFLKQEELLSMLNDSWGLRECETHRRILKDHPFDDLAGLRAIYCGQLRKQGYSEIEINEMAYKKYPKLK